MAGWPPRCLQMEVFLAASSSLWLTAFPLSSLEEQNQLKEYILYKKTDQSGFLDGQSGPTTLVFHHAEAGKAAAAQFTGLDALVGPIWC